MYKKILFILMLLWSTTLCASLFGDDEEEIVLPTHEIYFTGQTHFEEAYLQDALGVDTASFFQFWKDDTPRIKDKLLPTLEPSLKSFFDSEGFYDANFTIKETNTTIFVSITENEPVRVRDINISSDYNISSLVTFKKDDIFKAKTFISIKAKIITKLLNDGYCSYELDSKAYVDLDKHIVDVHYNLMKGGVCTFGKVTTTGLKTVSEEVVISRVKAKEGERFSPELVQETSDALYGLHAFDSVLINVDRKIYNVIPVDVKFTEMEKEYSLRTGAGYDSYVGMRVHAEITKNNFLGNAQQLKLKTAYSEKEQLIVLSYYKPALMNLFDHNIDLAGRLGYSNLEFEGFKEKKTFTRGYLEHESGALTLRAGLALENIEITALDNLKAGEKLERAVNEGTFNLFYPYLDLRYDGRDSKLNPKYGFYLSAYAEFGVSSDEESTAYYKTLLEGRFIHSFSDLTLSAVGKAGVVDEEKRNSLPESKYFFGGGSFSNRAYGFRQLGVIASPSEYTIFGAASMANLSLEANHPVWGDIYGAVFTDNTMLTAESYDFSGDIITSAGLGARYMTPVGPFKIDIGWNVNKTSDYAISFQIGQSF